MSDAALWSGASSVAQRLSDRLVASASNEGREGRQYMQVEGKCKEGSIGALARVEQGGYDMGSI